MATVLLYNHNLIYLPTKVFKDPKISLLSLQSSTKSSFSLLGLKKTETLLHTFSLVPGTSLFLDQHR